LACKYRPDDRDDKISDSIGRFAPKLTCKSVQRVKAPGARPGAMLELAGAATDGIESVHGRFNGTCGKKQYFYRNKIGV
jgi:hypothetical protein